jgi:hypothetical protein
MSPEASQRLVSMSAQEMFRIVMKHLLDTVIMSKRILVKIDTLLPIVVWSLDRQVREQHPEFGMTI